LLHVNQNKIGVKRCIHKVIHCVDIFNDLILRIRTSSNRKSADQRMAVFLCLD
jgi:hypothetical protein